MRLPAIFADRQLRLERGFDTELHRTWSTDGEDAGAETNETGAARAFRPIGRATWLVELRRPIDGVCCAIQRSRQDCARTIVVLAVKKIVERRLRFDAEALPSVDRLDGPTETDIKGEEGIVSSITLGRQRELRAATRGCVQRRSHGAKRGKLALREEPRRQQTLARRCQLVSKIVAQRLQEFV